MYESYYGLSKKPFSLTSDAEFVYLGQTHSTAFAMLEYGVLSEAGFTVLTGEVGSGKTTLIYHLLKGLNRDVSVGLITNTRRNMGELLPWVLHAFNLDYREENPIALYDKFAGFLSEQYESRRRTVLIVDEAQNLGPEVLDELRMLSNLNATSDQCLQVILVGQPELRQILSEPDLMQFSQRVAVDYHIAPLTMRETVGYVKYRLIEAGATQEVFTPHAYVVIHTVSRGVPRLINILCDTALSSGFGDGRFIIDEAYMREVLKERAEGGLLALGQDPLRQLGEQAFMAVDLDDLFSKISFEMSRGMT